MRYPTAKTIRTRLPWLSTIGDPADLARKVRRILDGTDRAPQPPGMYNPAGKVQRKMYALDKLLNTFGAEYIPSRQDTCTTFKGLEYLNTGDSYTPTVIFDCDTGTWRIGSWGDITERNERRFGA